MREIRLHDTASGEVRPLHPRQPGEASIYACGPTVYSRIHIGNARPYVVFSLLARFLGHEGLKPTLVINVTDVNDKIYTAAAATGVPSAELAAEMTAHYRADTGALGLGRPTHEPLASETIPGIVAYIEALVAGGHAYVAGADVLFRVRSDEAYGSLSHRRVDDMDQGEGVQGADAKEDPLDFALWKAHKPGEDTSWDSPWGPGRPGWHIECSAMAEEFLGTGFDIHGGGSDLVFPHHENEAAQTRCARGAELAQLWVHNGMIQMGDKDKMSKSLGNVALLHEVIERHGRDAVVFYLVSGHYRQPLEFSEGTLEQAAASVRRLREAARRLAPGPSPAQLRPLRDQFLDALADDFNTPRALEALFGWVREANSRPEGDGVDDLAEMLTLLGLEALLASEPGAPAEVVALAQARLEARSGGDYSEADRLRDAIAEQGWTVRDAAGGFSLVPR